MFSPQNRIAHATNPKTAYTMDFLREINVIAPISGYLGRLQQRGVFVMFSACPAETPAMWEKNSPVNFAKKDAQHCSSIRSCWFMKCDPGPSPYASYRQIAAVTCSDKTAALS